MFKSDFITKKIKFEDGLIDPNLREIIFFFLQYLVEKEMEIRVEVMT